MVTPFYKKDDKFCKINYRPVTVLPPLNNFFERLLSGQRYEFYNGLLSDFIRAYCKTSLLRLTEDWRMIHDRRGELVVVVSMYLSKAFDVIQYPPLLLKLRTYGTDDISLAELGELKLETPFRPWKASSVGSCRGV